MPLYITPISKRGTSENPSCSTQIPGGMLMDRSVKQNLKTRLGLPKKTKTFGIDFGKIKDLKDNADNNILKELDSNGLIHADAVVNFCKSRSKIINLGPLYGNNNVALELTKDNKVKTSFTLKVGKEPIFFNSVSENFVKKVDFFSLIFRAKVINSLSEEFLIELIKRKKAIVVVTPRDGNSENISNNCTIYELVFDPEIGEVSYKKLFDNQSSVKKSFQEHSLANIIHNIN